MLPNSSTLYEYPGSSQTYKYSAWMKEARMKSFKMRANQLAMGILLPLILATGSIVPAVVPAFDKAIHAAKRQ